MAEMTNRRLTSILMMVTTAVIIGLNVYLLLSTVASLI